MRDICFNTLMPGPYAAPVFNQSEADFSHAADRVKWEGPESMGTHAHLLREQAPSLYTYIGQYKRDVVIPFNRDPETKKMIEGGNTDVLAFDVGATTAFRMVDGVYRDTGAELPDLREDGIEPANPDEIDFESDIAKRIIDLFYRGAELRDRLPHVYRPSFKLMSQLLMDPPEQLEADMPLPATEHRNLHLAMAEMHFLGGVAETVLTIEDHAARSAA